MRRLLLTALTVALVAAGSVPASLAAFTSATGTTRSTVTASPDWTAPTVTLRDPGALLRGEVVLTVDAADLHSTVAQVKVEQRATGTSAWLPLCTASPVTGVHRCTVDTRALADGSFDLRAVATDAHGNTAVSPIVAARVVDNLAPTVAIVPLADAIRGTVVVEATAADAGTGVVSVRVQRSPADAGTWSEVCTTTVLPARCTLVTTSLPNDDLDLRAIATDGAGNTTTSVIETVLVDNLAPNVTVVPPSGTLSGVVTIAANATDAHAGVATVTIERRPAGAGTWTALCVDDVAPWGCRFDTLALPAGTYEFRATAVDLAGNTATSATVTRTVSNVAASVSVEDPGDLLRGTVTVDAVANDPAGVHSVRIERAASGGGAWTPLCTTTSAPHRCTWDTTLVPDGLYDLRAVLTSVGGGTTTSAVVARRQVDNTPLRGVDVQGANGGQAGRIDAGDTLTVTYDERLDLTTVVAGWTGTPRQVHVRLRDGALVGGGARDDTLDVFTAANLQTPVRFGSVRLGSDLIKTGKQGTVTGTLTATTVTLDGRQVTALVLRVDQTPSAAVGRTSTATATMVWSPSAGVRDVFGNPGSTAPVTETGALDRDL